MTASPYTIRNYHPNDFDNLLRFFQSVPSAILFTRQQVSDWLSWPCFTPEQDLFIVESDDGIIGYMNLRPELNIDRVVLNCRLHPKNRRKGISGRLLESALRRANQLGASIAHVDVMENNEIARKALEKHGFKPVRRYYELKLSISRVDWEEAARASQGCRHLLPGEEAALANIQNRSFAEHWGYNPNTEDMISFSINRAHSSPEDIVLACEEDDIVGFCRTEITDNGEGRISMIGTDPDFRGKGVGRKSLLAGLFYLKSKGVQTVYLTVDTVNETALTLYKSVGFEHNSVLITYEKAVDGT